MLTFMLDKMMANIGGCKAIKCTQGVNRSSYLVCFGGEVESAYDQRGCSSRKRRHLVSKEKSFHFSFNFRYLRNERILLDKIMIGNAHSPYTVWILGTRMGSYVKSYDLKTATPETSILIFCSISHTKSL